MNAFPKSTTQVDNFLSHVSSDSLVVLAFRPIAHLFVNQMSAGLTDKFETIEIFSPQDSYTEEWPGDSTLFDHDDCWAQDSTWDLINSSSADLLIIEGITASRASQLNRITRSNKAVLAFFHLGVHLEARADKRPLSTDVEMFHEACSSLWVGYAPHVYSTPPGADPYERIDDLQIWEVVCP